MQRQNSVKGEVGRLSLQNKELEEKLDGLQKEKLFLEQERDNLCSNQALL